MTSHRKIVIAGTGSYLPERVLTNADLEKMVDTNDEWIVQRTGIRERRIKEEGIGTSSLAVIAATRALEMADLSPEEVDFIAVGTVTPDSPFPSVGNHLQRKLGCRFIPAFDISAACTSFLYGIYLASSALRLGTIRNALILGAECLSAITDYEDRATSILFGDGAGAVVLKATEDPEAGDLLATQVHADGSGADLMYVPGGGSCKPASVETVKNRMHYMKLKGREIFRFAVEKFIKQIRVCIEKAGIQPEEVGLIVPHQVNIRIIEAAIRKLKIPMEKVKVNIDRFGNTSAASIPIALDEEVRAGRLDRGQYVILVAFGAGLTWGSAVFRY
jgi:3-oxoacyl-[acyl-carrier-protein] synthase-3